MHLQSSNHGLQELMTGGNMKQLVWKHMMANGGTAYTLAEGLDICLQMARGLKYLHSCQPMVRARQKDMSYNS